MRVIDYLSAIKSRPWDGAPSSMVYVLDWFAWLAMQSMLHKARGNMDQIDDSAWKIESKSRPLCFFSQFKIDANPSRQFGSSDF